MSSISNNNPSIDQKITALKELSAQAVVSQKKAQKSLSGIQGRVISALPGFSDHVPKAAAKHIEIHQQLEKAVNEMNAMGKHDKIPAEVITTLKESKETVRKIANKVNYSAYLKLTTQNSSTYTDSTKLLTPLNPNDKPSHSNVKEWELNFGLLYSAYERTDNEATKKTIRFLMANYLAKAAFLNEFSKADLSDKDRASYEKMLQLGQLTMGGMYHRTVDTLHPILQTLGLVNDIGSPDEQSKDLVPLDTMQVQELYSVSFVETPDLSKRDEIVNILVNQFEAHLNQFPGTNMEFPVLIDITNQIGQSLITEGKSEKIKEYENKQQEVRDALNSIIHLAAEKIKQKHPDNPDIQSNAADYLRTNLAVVSRAKINEHVSVMGMHKNIFDKADFANPLGKSQRIKFMEAKIKEWAGHTATGVGAVNFRQAIADSRSEPKDISKVGMGHAVEYAVSGRTDILMYAKPNDITDINAFKKLKEIAEGKNPQASEGQQMMAKATVKMMTTLLNKISEKDWTEKQNDPVIRELTQTSLFRIAQHLATATHQTGDFRQFSQAIDRTHADLTTLLALYSPFDKGSFDTEYRKFLQPLFPPSIQPTEVGIARSAMNVFAGVNAAVLQGNPNPVRICGAHSYYEEAGLVGGNRTINQALADPNVEKVDLYVAEFYHNIDIDPNHTQYQKGTVIKDIKEIFEKKPKTDSLTVSIDATIDVTNSEDIAELFREFEDKIREGRLNIVIFRSGQKFDMMGLDNYFGSPFYMVNNKDPKWNKFQNIKTGEAFQTDPLSQQFFNWMAETGPELVDQYKTQIFNNTRQILNAVPEELKPAAGKEVCVCTFDEGVKTPFIDIKINLADEDQKADLEEWVRKRFIEMFTQEDKLVYVRGSFGFPHANITWIDPKMRINPGIDPSENALYQKFFLELNEKVKELQKA